MFDALEASQAKVVLQQRFILDQIVAEMAARAPDRWERIEAVMMPLGKIRGMNFEIHTVDGLYYGVPDISMPDKVVELLDIMYVEGRGTWFTLALTIWSSGEVSTRVSVTQFSFEVDGQGEEFVVGIVNKMVELFGFSEKEALGRVNRQFNGLDIVGRDDPIYSEPVTFWAKDIVYGHDAMWWKDENSATPLSYPCKD